MFIDIVAYYFRTNYCLVINLKQNRFEIKKKYHMTYKIRYLAIYIGSLEVCNVRYILSYNLQKYETLHQKRS